MIWNQNVNNLVRVVAAPAITTGTPYNEYRLIVVISTAPTGKPAVIVSTVA
jgi:hypothetical protein